MAREKEEKIRKLVDKMKATAKDKEKARTLRRYAVVSSVVAAAVGVVSYFVYFYWF
jgi:hypothetical protein